jgi:hypothetical protein
VTIDENDRASADAVSWHDRPPVVVAAGVAGLVLIALLVYAVIHITDDPSRPPGAPASDLDTSVSRAAPSSTSTSYAVPRPQTSDTTPPVSAPALPPPESGVPDPGTTQDTPTDTPTVTNPYAPTTTQNADAI